MSDPNAARTLRGDSVFLARLRAGDEVAFDTLVRAYGGALIRNAARMIGSADSAQEIVQDVFLYLWRERANIDTTWDISAYLYRSVRNRAIDVARSDRATNSREHRWASEIREEFDSHTIDETEADAAEIRVKVWNALADVPPRCREIFMLVWDRQLPYREIGQMLGLAEPTVRSQVSRAMKRLIDVLGQSYESS